MIPYLRALWKGDVEYSDTAWLCARGIPECVLTIPVFLVYELQPLSKDFSDAVIFILIGVAFFLAAIPVSRSVRKEGLTGFWPWLMKSYFVFVVFVCGLGFLLCL